MTVAVGAQTFRQGFLVGGRNFFFSGGINVGDDNAVRVVKSRAEHFKQIGDARIAVRLKNGDDFFGATSRAAFNVEAISIG